MKNVTAKALKVFQKVQQYIIRKSSVPDLGFEKTWFVSCELTNPYNNYCPTKDISDKDSVIVSVYNPGPQRDYVVRIPVYDQYLDVIDMDMNTRIDHQVIKYYEERLRT